MLGLSVDFLSLIERGRNAPSFEKLEVMAKGLGKPVAYFFPLESQTLNHKRRQAQELAALSKKVGLPAGAERGTDRQPE